MSKVEVARRFAALRDSQGIPEIGDDGEFVVDVSFRALMDVLGLADIATALEPFAEVWIAEDDDDDDWNLWEHPAAMNLTVAWDEMDASAQRILTAQPHQMSQAAERLEAARLSMRGAVQSRHRIEALAARELPVVEFPHDPAVFKASVAMGDLCFRLNGTMLSTKDRYLMLQEALVALTNTHGLIEEPCLSRGRFTHAGVDHAPGPETGEGSSADGWRHIASAPKDGTQIVLFDANVAIVAVGHWMADVGWRNASKKFGEALVQPNWFPLASPTHWCPLPLGPSA